MTTQHQPFTAITIPVRAKILLLVELQQPGTEDDCLHLVRIPNSGYQVCCNASTEEHCIACGRPTCPAHFSERTLYVQDHEVPGEYQLCCQCAQLTREELEIVRELRLSLNN
jgi:hypothetical protein